jgi:hypothetical protein
MKPIAPVLAAAAVLAILLTSAVRPIPTAYACSAGPDFDPIAESDLIIGGWVVGWRERPDIPSPLNGNAKSGVDYKSLGMLIDVDRVFKGSPVKRVEAVDSYIPYGTRWLGTSCAIFGGDPTGLYVILGLWRGEDGYLHPNSLRTFFIGENPSGEGYDYAMRRLEGLPAIGPPRTGSGGLVAPSRIY